MGPVTTLKPTPHRNNVSAFEFALHFRARPNIRACSVALVGALTRSPAIFFRRVRRVCDLAVPSLDSTAARSSRRCAAAACGASRWFATVGHRGARAAPLQCGNRHARSIPRVVGQGSQRLRCPGRHRVPSRSRRFEADGCSKCPILNAFCRVISILSDGNLERAEANHRHPLCISATFSAVCARLQRAERRRGASSATRAWPARSI